MPGNHRPLAGREAWRRATLTHGLRRIQPCRRHLGLKPPAPRTVRDECVSFKPPSWWWFMLRTLRTEMLDECTAKQGRAGTTLVAGFRPCVLLVSTHSSLQVPGWFSLSHPHPLPLTYYLSQPPSSAHSEQVTPFPLVTFSTLPCPPGFAGISCILLPREVGIQSGHHKAASLLTSSPSHSHLCSGLLQHPPSLLGQKSLSSGPWGVSPHRCWHLARGSIFKFP